MPEILVNWKNLCTTFVSFLFFPFIFIIFYLMESIFFFEKEKENLETSPIIFV